jgi:anti-sigma factor RsiW
VTCREFADFMMDYLTGDLQPEVIASFDRHLSACPNCHTYLAQYRATIAAGQSAFADDNAAVPTDVPEELIRAILSSRKR